MVLCANQQHIKLAHKMRLGFLQLALLLWSLESNTTDVTSGYKKER